MLYFNCQRGILTGGCFSKKARIWPYIVPKLSSSITKRTQLTPHIPSHPKKSGAPAFEELFGLRNFPLFFWQWESIQCSIIQTPGMKEPLAIFGPRKFMFGASSQAPRADFLVHFQPVASLKTNRMQKKVTRNSLGLAQSSEGKSPLFQIKNPPSTLAKVRQLQWTNPNIHLYFQFICSKLFRYCSYYS